MKRVIRRSTAAMTLAALVSLATLLDAGRALGQTCAATRVFNATTCTINLCLYDAGGIVNCYIIPPGGPTVIALGAFVPIGVRSAGGFFYPFVPPPNPGCTICIALPATAVNCCGIVCYDRVACRIDIRPCPSPCRL